MSRLLVAIAFSALLLPQAGSAQSSLFELVYKEAKRANPDYLSEQLIEFVGVEMQTWRGSGIWLSSDDIKYAIEKNQSALCKDKTTIAGTPIQFVMGGNISGESCIGLQGDILSLIASEQEAEQLGADLLTIANGSELALSNEPHRPLEMGKMAMLLKRTWVGSGGAVIPWDGTADSEVQTLDSALAALTPADLDKAILRFHHGYFRDQREADPAFSVVAGVGDALRAIANKLRITGDPTMVGEFATPKLKVTPNVALWARKDDLGILWVYPMHFARGTIERAGEYPVMVENGETLAYPFSYKGSTPPTDPEIRSPLCSRSLGRFGYLCRPQPPFDEDCTRPGSDGITLVKCSEKTTETESSPKACADLENLYSDTGGPLEDPDNPAHVSPDLELADLEGICAPDTKVLYQDSVASNTCYIDHCLIQSMRRHTLIPNRNTVLLNEATSPFLACIRRDPQLGRYTEIAHPTPFAFPPYIGHLLTIDYEREYCVKNGNAPHPLAGYCAYRSSRRSNSPDIMQFFTAAAMNIEAQEVAEDQDTVLSAAANIGERAALEQSATVQRKVFGSLASFVQQVADLLLELKNAPLTKTPCPWTGPFKTSSSAAP
ncbi:MAG: hypothetical protein WC840_00245 [Candidatus Peribacteraceae bacterium]